MTVYLHESLKGVLTKVHIVSKCHHDWTVLFADINVASNTLLLEENFMMPSAPSVPQWNKEKPMTSRRHSSL